MEGVKFIINGKALAFCESKDNCRLLLEDDAYTIDYIRRAVLSGQLVNHGISVDDVDSLSIIRDAKQDFAPDALKEAEKTSDSQSCEEYFANSPNIEGFIDAFSPNKGKSKEFSRETTSSLLLLRGSDKYQKLFNDKKSSKGQLWNKVAQELTQMGYNLGDKAPGEKCRQKFANLQKSYTNFKNNMRQTGTGAIDKPWFYDDVDAILGDKHKINPPVIFDSENDTPDPAEIGNSQSQSKLASSDNCTQEGANVSKDHSEKNREDAGSSKEAESPTSRFDAKKTTKPPASTPEILREIHNTSKLVLAENRQMIAEHFKRQDEMQKQENEYKASIVKLLTAIMQKDKRNKKRKHSESESD